MPPTSPPAKSLDQTEVSPPEQLLRAAEVHARTKIGKTRRNELIRKGEFPAPIQICGGRTNYWIAAEVEEWLRKQIQQHRARLTTIARPPLDTWLSKATNHTEQALKHSET